MIAPDAVLQAAERIAPYIHRTPVITSRTLDSQSGGSLFFKCENFQRVGAFKIRGAMNAVLQLSEDQKRAGVVTHSSGNHAQALALAGRLAGVRVCVVMPETAPAVKRIATEGYGATVVPCGPTINDRERAVADLIERHGYTLVHPYDDWNVIAGAGTAALELIDQAGPLDAILTPLGGGGLVSGTALAARAVSPSTLVYGAEPAAADDARLSVEYGSIQPSVNPPTCCDGLRSSIGPKTFEVIRQHVAGIPVACEAEILEAMRTVWERLKVVAEPSAVVPLAVVRNGQVDARGKRIGIILSGGNVDLGPLFRDLEARWT